MKRKGIEPDGKNEKKLKTEESLLTFNERSLELKSNLDICTKYIRLKDAFFDQECLALSKNLLGKYLFRRFNGQNYGIARIVEVEAYLGGSDAASHTYNNRMTNRCKAMFMKAGTAYVYNIYGIYCCLNISSREPGAGVLIRALEPIFGLDEMKANRNIETTSKNVKTLTNGPSKLCISMNITKNIFNEVDLAYSNDLFVAEAEHIRDCNMNKSPPKEVKIVQAKRIGINYAGEEAMNQLYRFYIKDNKFVSIKSKIEIEISK
jgi:DNA-3-methyladenine glycosylase